MDVPLRCPIPKQTLTMLAASDLQKSRLSFNSPREAPSIGSKHPTPRGEERIKGEGVIE